MRVPIWFLRPIVRPQSQARAPILAAGLLLFVCVFAHAQSGSSRPASQSPDPAPPAEKGDHPDFGDPVNEIKTKLLIREDKKLYEENIARAKEADEIASQLCESYEAQKTFTSEDQKKLERLEKLTKRIRNEAGGSDTSADDSDPPKALAATDSQVKTYGTAAVVVARTEMRFTRDNQEQKLAWRSTRLYVKSGSKWKLAAEQRTSL